MTDKEAYIEGFCKVAEVYGIDPLELAKYAQAVKTPKTARTPQAPQAPQPPPPGVHSAISDAMRRGGVKNIDFRTAQGKSMLRQIMKSKPHLAGDIRRTFSHFI